MPNGLPHSEAWRRLLDDGQTVRVLELVIDTLDGMERRGQQRYDDAIAAQAAQYEALRRRMFWVTSTLVSVLVSLIAVVRFV